MRQYKGLDLFSGAGGASMGYHRAGFLMTGIDHRPQPAYPFHFVQADALEYVAQHGREYDAIFASPPCQGYSITRHIARGKGREVSTPRLIEVVRALLRQSGRPYILENVPGAPLECPVLLCGSMFGLQTTRGRPLWRHRLFESQALLMAPGDGVHHPHALTVAGHGFLRQDAREAMGIDWMSIAELAQAIPPAYTQFLGDQLRGYL